MMVGRQRHIALALVAATALAGCGSADKTAALNASIAENALAQGQLTVARQYAQRALAARDDVSDYWLLLAHVDIAASDLAGAFDAYQNVLSLDRGNVEALTTLCQIGLAGGDASRATQFADQLALVNPTSTLPRTVRAAAALQRGDQNEAGRLLREVLDKAPDDLGALIVESKLLAAQNRYAEGAAVIERSLASPGNPNSRLDQLKLLYTKAGDRDGYERTVARLAAANPTEARRQLDHADVLYDDGERDRAYAISRAVLAMRPGDIAIASAVLDLWLRQGADAMPLERVTADAGQQELEGKASYAEFATWIGRPDLAVAILPPQAIAGSPSPANSDAKAAAAFAAGLRGDRSGATTALDAILAVDPKQPRALLARARLRPDPVQGLADARQVLADDAGNVRARLTVADLLLAQREPLLAETVLREGLTAADGDSRVAERLARLLTARGQPAGATATLTAFARAHPVSRRAQALATRGSGRPTSR